MSEQTGQVEYKNLGPEEAKRRFDEMFREIKGFQPVFGEDGVMSDVTNGPSERAQLQGRSGSDGSYAFQEDVVATGLKRTFAWYRMGGGLKDVLITFSTLNGDTANQIEGHMTEDGKLVATGTKFGKEIFSLETKIPKK